MPLGKYILKHYTPIRKASIWNTDTPNATEDVEQQELSYTAGRNAKWYSHFPRQFGGFLQNQCVCVYIYLSILL